MPAGSAPIPSASGALWRGEPPDPLAQADLYDGVVWRRVIAYVCDLLVLVALSLAVWAALTLVGLLSFGLLMPLVPVGLALAPIAYHALFVGGPRSSTWGMRLLGIEVRSWTGRRPTLLQAALMAILFYATIALTGCLILLVVLLNARRRTLHDLLSGTVMIRSPTPSTASRAR